MVGEIREQKEKEVAEVVTLNPDTIMKQGAEARLFKIEFNGNPTVVKERFSKKYRHPILDKKITKRRTNAEVRAISRCAKLGIRSPKVIHVDLERGRIFMQFIDGETVRDFLVKQKKETDEYGDSAAELMRVLGKNLAKMHDGNLIHGDLTTSNFIIENRTSDLVTIDFGLSYQASQPEDKAVDLYVLERAFLSTHPKSEGLVQTVLDTYTKSSRNSSAVIQRLEKVRARGRKRSMAG
eukprot:118506_1